MAWAARQWLSDGGELERWRPDLHDLCRTPATFTAVVPYHAAQKAAGGRPIRHEAIFMYAP
jgi:hypothetical protein